MHGGKEKKKTMINAIVKSSAETKNDNYHD